MSSFSYSTLWTHRIGFFFPSYENFPKPFSEEPFFFT